MASHGFEYAYDDVTNAHLNAKRVRDARDLEIRLFKDTGAYAQVPRFEQRKYNGKILKTCWVDIDKEMLQSQTTGVD